MIQRLQTVYLALIIVILVLLCSIEIMHYRTVVPALEYKLNLFYFNKFENGALTETHMQFGLITISSIIMGLTAFIIGSYKDRKKQIKFGWINMVAIILLIVAFLVKAVLFIPGFDSSNLMVLSIFGLSIFFFIIYLNLRAIMLIKKDEELVRSADRIR